MAGLAVQEKDSLVGLHQEAEAGQLGDDLAVLAGVMAESRVIGKDVLAATLGEDDADRAVLEQQAGLRVLDKEDKPIPGLYTAGDCCRGLLVTDESKGKFGEMPWAMASGYLVGMEAAKYIVD